MQLVHGHGYHVPSSNLYIPDMISKMLAEQNILPEHSGPNLNSVTIKIVVRKLIYEFMILKPLFLYCLHRTGDLLKTIKNHSQY